MGTGKLIRGLVALLLGSAVFLAQQPSAFSQSGPQIPRALRESKPWQRFVWWYEERASPGETIPHDALLRAHREVQAYRAANPQLRSAAKWESVGPTPLENRTGDTFTAKTAVSGRIASIGVNPKKRKQLFIGAAQGGLQFSKNAGKSWKAVSDALPTLAIGAIAWAPSNKKVIYAGTGESVFSGVAYAGVGVLKSTNAGKTFKLVSQTDLSAINASAIIVDPKDADTLLMSTVGFGRRQVAFREDVGVYRSTDGGVTWSLMLQGHANHLVADPDDFNTQYAAIGQLFGQTQNGLYRSTDAGVTWSKQAGPWDGKTPGRMEIAISKSDPDTLYVGVQSTTSFGDLLGLWRTDNASARTGSRAPDWEEIDIPTMSGRDDYCEPQCWYDHVLLVDEKDPDVLWAGGVFLWKYDGKDWEVHLPGHVDIHALAWGGKTLYVGNDGGIFSTKNGGKKWTSHNSGLTLTQFYHGSVHPDRADFFMGGTQDNGTSVRDAGLARAAGDAWTRVQGGDGADNEVSPSNPDTNWAVSIQNGDLRRTTDGGQTFDRSMSAGVNTDEAPFIAVFTMCPSDENVMIFGTDRVWRANDFFTGGTPAWKDQGPKLGSDDNVRSIAFAPSDTKCNTYAIGTNDGEVHVTSNGGRKWTDASRGIPERRVTDLAFDPDDADVLWLVLSGFDENIEGAPGHVFMTSNATKSRPSWDNVTTPHNLAHNAIVIQPGGAVWVGSDLGVWELDSLARGAIWTHHGAPERLPNVAVYDLQATADQVVAFTHGRGAWVLEQ